VVAAALGPYHQGRRELFIKEIAVEGNPVLVARGEIRKLTPEKVGHKLKKVGMLREVESRRQWPYTRADNQRTYP
jgi:hypothetical protein